MKALAGFIVTSPLSAILVVIGSTLLGMLAPPLTSLLVYAGGGALALATLYAGSRAGLLVLAGSVLALSVVSLVAIRHYLPGMVMLLYWLPVWLAALVLRYSRSLAWATLSVCAVMALAVVLVFLVLGDPVAWWTEQLQAMVDTLVSKPEFGVDRDQLSAMLEQLPKLLTGLLAAGLVFACLVSLLLGRWWQSLLVNPGGLREEFYEFRLEKVISLVGLVLVGLASAGLGWLSNLSLQLVLVLMVPFLLAGLAVVHAVLARRKIHRGWLIALYVLMTVLPQVLFMVVVTGALDPWLDFRRRAQQN